MQQIVESYGGTKILQIQLCSLFGMEGSFQGRKRPYTTTAETFFSRVWGLKMVYTLSGPMVFTLFPWSSQANGIHHSCLCSVTSGSGNRPRRRGATVVVYTLSFPCLWVFQGLLNGGVSKGVFPDLDSF